MVLGNEHDASSFTDASEDVSSSEESSDCFSTSTDEEEEHDPQYHNNNNEETTTTTTTTTSAFYSFQSDFFDLRQRKRIIADEERGGELQPPLPDDTPSKANNRRKRTMQHNHNHHFWSQCSSYLLCIATCIWLLIQSYHYYCYNYYYYLTLSPVIPPIMEEPEWRLSPHGQEYAKLVQERVFTSGKQQQQQQQQKHQQNPLPEYNNNPRKSIRGNSKERMPDGCTLQDWQTQGHSNCNELHQLDLNHLLQNSFTTNENTTKFGKYLSSGLWRDVWSIPADYNNNSNNNIKNNNRVVLKMMKREHDVNDRNLDRHKREAIVMDVLTKSPHIVDMYSYCGNTVLTEYLPMDLDHYLRPTKRRQKEKHDQTTHPRMTTVPERLELAYQTALAVEELHEYDILHADLQSKQFLVSAIDEKKKKNGGSSSSIQITIKLNDFNRCRFLPRQKKTNKNETKREDICPISIPSSPGLARSPEEYALRGLTTAIDIYSLANVWFEILTGTTPWLEQPSPNKIKTLIMDGIKPSLPKPLEDEKVAVLMSLAYEVDPNKRATAKNLVQELERLMKE